MHRAITVAALAAIVLSGCASTGGAAEEPGYDKVYRTGSNLPTRENAPTRNTTWSPETLADPVRLPGGVPARPAGN